MQLSPTGPSRYWAVWVGSPVLKSCFALHVLVLVGVCIFPTYWLWGGGVLLILHVILAVFSLIPRSQFFGQNMLRLPLASVKNRTLALTFDDGPDLLVTPKVLDLLDQFHMRASFFVVGDNVLAYPELAREIARRGHSLENHTRRHLKYFSLLGPKRISQEIVANQQIIEHICGQAPRFVRPTAGFRSALLAPILERLGLKLATWSRRGFDTRDRRPARILERLSHNLAAGDILLLHDGNGARMENGEAVILEVLPALLARMKTLGLVSVTLPQACDMGGRNEAQR